MKISETRLAALVWVLVILWVGCLALAEARPFAVVATVAVAFVVVSMFYMWPARMAKERQHKNAEAIFYLNVLLGWTFIGWVIALVWAVKKE